MGAEKLTLGQAIDAVIQVLEPLDSAVRDVVLSAACTHLGILFGTPAAPQMTPPAVGNLSQQPAVAQRPAAQVDIRSLKDQKQPRSAKQMACVVAFYLQELAPEADRKATIGAPDLEKYFKQAGFKLPTKISQLLVDAKQSGYFDSAGRGEYRLNAVGYNLVAHGLPSAVD